MKILTKRILIYLIIFLFVVILDQSFKTIIFKEVGFNNTKPLIAGLMQFTVVQNTGGAFSIFKEHPIYFKIIGIINVFLFSYLVFCPTVFLNLLMKIGCVLILGGTVGNLIDRFIRGGVIDFIDLQFINFAIFNLADVFIDLGVLIILIGWYFSKIGVSCDLPKANE